MAEYDRLLIAGAANTVSHSCVWVKIGNSTSIAYALHNMVAIVDVSLNTVVCTLRSHAATIVAISHCVLSDGIELYSGASDGSVHVWRHDLEGEMTAWKRVDDLVGLKSPLTCLTSLRCSDKTLVAASDSQGNLVVWKVQRATVSADQALRLPPAQMAYSLCLTQLPTLDKAAEEEERIVLFVGCVDARIHIYVADERLQFRSVGALMGHEEWVTCLSTTIVDERTIMLASGSRDTKIRLWKITVQASSAAVGQVSTEVLDTPDDNAGEEDIQEDGHGAEVAFEEEEDSMSEARLQFSEGEGQSFAVFLEALLVGHEDWVTSVHFMELASGLRLFSTSMDRTMVIWAPDEAAGGVWISMVGVGDIGGSLGGSVGGNLLGFVSGCMSPDRRSLLGIGYGGSFHLWSRSKQLLNNRLMCDVSVADRRAFSADTADEERWYPIPFLSGHFGSVNDVAWQPSRGEYLVSVSADQTCRLYAPLKRLNVCLDHDRTAPVGGASTPLWKEISRPQIHGYDLNCLVLAGDSCHLFTGGEEKLIRVFDAPQVVLQGLETISGVRAETGSSSSRVAQAYIPELGLSNKAMETMTSQERKEQEARCVSAIDWRFHPLESQLADYTLWPEVRKMFGHSNDVMVMSMSNDSRWLASANKARDANSAQVLLWNGVSRELVTRMTGHESTVVCLQFSPSNRFLASSGKDRAILIYQLTVGAAGVDTFELAVFKKAAHKRIVWDLSWTSDSSQLVSVSRDGICKIWSLVTAGDKLDLECLHSFSPFGGVSVTALDCVLHRGRWLVAFGAESGDLAVEAVTLDGKSNELVSKIDARYCHGATVRRIRWRPAGEGKSDDSMCFASCGEDTSVRIHNVRF